MAKTPGKITVPVTIAPAGGTNRVIALNQAIQSFSYEDRQALLRVRETMMQAEAPSDGDLETKSWRDFEKAFEDTTDLIVERAKAFAKFLEN